MSRRPAPGSGLEGAPDIMLLTMAALMVALVWLVSQAHETALPPIDLPSAEIPELGGQAARAVYVTLEPAQEGVRVYLGETELEGGLEALEAALAASGAGEVTLRAEADLPWRIGLEAMSAAARLELPVSVAVER